MGHVFVDIAQPQAAITAYKHALALREALDPPESPPIADVCDSVACAYTEAGDIEQAFAYLQRATDIHNAHDPSKMSRTLAIRALTCLRAGQTDAALDAIRQCWALQNMTQDRIQASRYPKHSGDIILLARILWLQGEKTAAQELASRSITMRRGTYGEKGGPRVADSLFTVARMFEESGELVLAAKVLREIVDMSGEAPEMRAHLARALWFSAKVEGKIGGNEEKVSELVKEAREKRDMIEGKEWPDEDSDEGFVGLVSWMLW